MSSKLVVVVDLQHFKLFRIKVDPLERESLECLLSSDSLDIHQKPSEKFSDQQGHCKTAWGIQGGAENHAIEMEEERKRLKELSETISKALLEYPHEAWYFAAPKAIYHAILEKLEPALTQTLTSHVLLDLTKTPTDEILEHFKH
ncbi:MAG: host attachment protein [Campylobacterales bacterium]|nr:host attachment protein [Campylobacterales bacterium]